jgi:hypothetical protein
LLILFVDGKSRYSVVYGLARVKENLTKFLDCGGAKASLCWRCSKCRNQLSSFRASFAPSNRGPPSTRRGVWAYRVDEGSRPGTERKREGNWATPRVGGWS